MRVDGRDAQDFLHRQLTADVAALATDRCVQAGYCQPDGRLLATPQVFWLAGQLHLVLPTELVDPVTRRLRMFVLRDDVRLEITDLHCVPVPPAQAPKAGHTQGDEHGLTIGLAGDVPRALRISETPEQAIDDHDWRTACIEAGAPEVYAATSGEFLPQSLRLDHFGGVNFRKGCYPGQEVVARLHYRGQLKRLLTRAQITSGHCHVGDTIHTGDRSVGMVADASASAALVVIHQNALGVDAQTPEGTLSIEPQSLTG